MMLMNDSMGKEGGRTEFTGMMHNYRISSIRRRGYYFFSLPIFVRLLFEGSVYFFGKSADTNNGWIRYVRAIQ